MLISGWLNIGQDQIVGTNQTRESYWNRIWDYFHTHKMFVSDRTANSLSHRWSAIQESVNKFCDYYDGVMHRAPSGTTDTCKITMAMAAFEKGEGMKFKMMHCRNVLHGEQKWTNRLSAKKVKGTTTPCAAKGTESMDSTSLGRWAKIEQRKLGVPALNNKCKRIQLGQ